MTRPEILDAAKKCVCGDREQDYGTPEKNFGTIAALWTAYKSIELTAVDVAAMLSLVKLGRIASGHGKSDNWIDLAGYAACGGEIESANSHAPADSTHKPTQAELEDLFDSEECVCGLTSVAKGEPVNGKYEGLSNDGLHDKICLGMSCEKCLLDFTHNDCGGGCWAFQDNHPEEFRKIAIEYLEGLEGEA